MISKDTFCTVFTMIQEQQDIDQQFSDALDFIEDRHYVFGCENKYFQALMKLLKESMNDSSNVIEHCLVARMRTLELHFEKKHFIYPESVYECVVKKMEETAP